MSNLNSVREANLYDTLVKTLKEYVVEEEGSEETLRELLHGIDRYTLNTQNWVVALGDLQVAQKIRPGLYPALDNFYLEHGKSTANPDGIEFVSFPFVDYIPEVESSDLDQALRSCINSSEDVETVKSLIEEGSESALVVICNVFESSGKATNALLPLAVGHLRARSSKEVEEGSEEPETTPEEPLQKDKPIKPRKITLKKKKDAPDEIAAPASEGEVASKKAPVKKISTKEGSKKTVATKPYTYKGKTYFPT